MGWDANWSGYCSFVLSRYSFGGIKKKKGKVAQVFREYFFIELKGQANLSEIEALSKRAGEVGEERTLPFDTDTRVQSKPEPPSLFVYKPNPSTNQPTYFGRPLRMDEAETRARRFP